jgi:hypothetical protein
MGESRIRELAKKNHKSVAAMRRWIASERLRAEAVPVSNPIAPPQVVTASAALLAETGRRRTRRRAKASGIEDDGERGEGCRPM